MKHKIFNQVYPYVYYIEHIETSIKYFGVRYANIKQNRTPLNDFLKYYFTSIKSKEFSWFKDLLRSDLSKFKFRLVATFDTKEEAILYEKKITKKIYKKSNWANMCSGKAICMDEKTRKTVRAKGASTYSKKCKSGFKPTFSEYGLFKKREYAKMLNDKNKKSPPRLGVVLSDETKDKIRISNTGKKFPERENNGNPMFGKGGLYKIESPSGEFFNIRGGAGKFLIENNVSESSLFSARTKNRTVITRSGWKVTYLSD